MRKIITIAALLLAVFFSRAEAQERQVTGKVTAPDGSTLPGVTVIVKGTTIGTNTDMDGAYKLSVPPEGKTLKFIMVGMKSKEVEIGTSATVDVMMENDVMNLDEVVVTSNAISREKRSLGYATTQVKGDDLTSAKNTNVIGALEGKVAGINITSLTGGPGSSQRIVIRGGSSLVGNNQALIVVDGVPINNDNLRTTDDLNNQVDYGNRGNDINPEDIENISVLKGPAAAALYGSSASNGAIIITTKKGKHGVGGASKMDVTFSTGMTWSSILKLPTFQNTYGEGDMDNIADDRRENFSWGLPFDGKLRPWGQYINGQSRVKPYSAIPNNVRDFFDLGTGFNNHVSISGGNDKSTYFMSISASNNSGIVPTTTFDKYNILFNGSTQLSNHFSSSISLNYANIARRDPSGGQGSNSVYSQLIETARDIPIVDGKDLNDTYNQYLDYNPKTGTGTYGFYGAYYMDPYFTLNNFVNTSKVDRVFGNASVSYENWGWLTISDRIGTDTYSDRRYQSWKKYNYYPLDESGLYSSANNATYQGKYSQDIANLMNFNNDLMVTAKRQLSKTISGTLLLGQNIRESVLDRVFGQTNADGGLSLAGYYNLDNSKGAAVVNNSTTQTRHLSYYYDANFDYKNMLFLGITGRNDKSSTLFGTSNPSYFYSSLNASWVFTELMKQETKDKFLSYGKIRASYAKVGNDAPAYSTANYYPVTTINGGWGSTVFPFVTPAGNISGFTVGDQNANPGIKPEFTTAYEVGTELGFFKDRISIDFSYYANKSTDQIIPLSIPPSTGFTTQIINAGVVSNKGIELFIKGVPVLTKSGFKWEVYGTYTKNTSLVESLYGGVNQLVVGGFSGVNIVAQVGQPYGSFYAIDIAQDPNGHPIVDSSTGLPKLTPNPVNKGSYLPKFQASWGTNLTYKGFSLNVLFDTKQGGVFFSNTKSITDFNGTSLESADYARADHVWDNSVYMVSDGTVNPTNKYLPNSTKFHPYTYYVTVEQNVPGQYIVDASYIKMREASLAYQIPTKCLKKTPFGSATVALFGNNLFIWTAAQNKFADPEQNSSGASNAQGFEFSSNPSQRNYGIDLKLTF